MYLIYLSAYLIFDIRYTDAAEIINRKDNYCQRNHGAVRWQQFKLITVRVY